VLPGLLCASPRPMSGQGRPWPSPAPTGPGSVVPEHTTQVLRSLARRWCGRGRRRGDLCPPHDSADTDVGVGVCVHAVGPDGSGSHRHGQTVLSLLCTLLDGVHSSIFSCFFQRGADRSTPLLPHRASFQQFIGQPCCGSSQELSTPSQSTPRIHNNTTTPPVPLPCRTFLKLLGLPPP